MNKKAMLLPLLAGFFVMGFGDIIGTVMNQVKAECAANADSISWLMPIFAYVWFLVISIPTGVLSGRIGRKNAVLVSLAVTVAAMVVPLFANAERWYLYVVAFALVGIGNTIIQAALPALMSNVVEPSQLASRISLGQFVKALCAALTPVFVYLTATALGDWKLLFPLYGALTVGAAAWLWLTKIPDERAQNPQTFEPSNSQTTFSGCLAMLKEPYVAAMTAGILFSVGADVGFSVAIPEYLKNVFKVDINLAGMGPTVYFIAKTVAAFAGAIVFAKVSAAKCFPWCMGIGLAATAAIPFVGTAFAFLAIVAAVALLTANSFGMCMALAIERFPAKANEITSLMVMAIVGGGIVSAVLGFAQSAFGPVGIVATLGLCIAYLFGLGLFASRRIKKAVALAIAASCMFASSAEAACKGDIFTQGEFFVGCNYWAKNAGMYMWSQWDRGVVEKELAALAENGVTVIRVFPLWSDFQPLTGDCDAGGGFRSFRFRDNRPLPNEAGVDPVMIGRFRDFCDIAEKNGIRLIVGIVTGWMSGRQFVPPVFENRNVLSDPEAVMWQTRFVRHFVNALKDHKAIAAWDYGNECNCMGETTQAEFYNWMDHIGSAIRLADPTRPVVSGMHGLSTCERDRAPIRLNGELSDILCTHPYQFYVPGCGKEAFNTMRTELHPTAESILYRDLGGKPCFIEEIGNLGTSCTSDERSAAGMRATMFSAWANDLKGVLWWCNSDQEVLEFPPYTLTPCERELGMLRQDLSPKPVMLEMKAFQEFRRSLPFEKLPKARTDAVIVVPEKEGGWIAGFGAYLLARQAGINPSFAGAERDLPDSGLYVVCSAGRDVAYTYTAQKRIYEKAKNGATVLLIYSGESRFTQLREHAGVKIDYCALSPRDRTFELSAFSGRRISACDRTTCRLLDGEAEVLGRTTDGEPVFTSFRCGKGRILVCNAPIDRQAVERTDVLTGETVMPYYLVLREAAKIAGVRHVVEKGDCPWVGITEHPAEDGSTIVMAINFEPHAITCPVSLKGRIGRVWRGKVNVDAIELPPNEAALFEVR